jgi:type I restriction-modification system DNA methylase subunit
MEDATGMEPTQLGGISKYAVGYTVPPAFADVLRDLTREILRDQPKDVNKYAFEYFANKLAAAENEE